MKITYLGHASFLLETAAGTRIVTDPYAQDILPHPVVKAHVVTTSHEHHDHCDFSQVKGDYVIVNSTKTTIFQDVKISCVPCWHDEVQGQKRGHNRAYIFEADGLKIEGIAAAHETLDRDPVTGEYPYTGYVIEGNGVRLFHTGDCVVYDGYERKLLDRGPFDVLFLPINGRDGKRFRAGCIGNMTFQEAVCLTCALKPALTVPAHYDMFPGNTADPFDFTDYLEAKDPDLAFWLGGHGVPVRYRREA